jgi:hypothetical protein
MEIKQLSRLRALCDAAQPGPWHVTTNLDYWVEFPPVDPDDPDEFNGIAHCGDIHWPDYEAKQYQWLANAVFIAEARAALPAALDEIQRLQDELAKTRSALDAITEAHP